MPCARAHVNQGVAITTKRKGKNRRKGEQCKGRNRRLEKQRERDERKEKRERKEGEIGEKGEEREEREKRKVGGRERVY
jgi:ATP-dependent RNA helicase DDX46/PRP5